MQELMDLKLFELSGRKAELTNAGKLILKRSKQIVSQLSQLESAITHYKDGTEHEFIIMVDELFPIELLAIALKKFETLFPSTHVILINTRIDIDSIALQSSKADCAITRNKIRIDSDKLFTLDCYPYAHPDYDLHHNVNNQPIALHNLHHHRQIIHDAFTLPQISDGSHHCCQWHVDSLNMMMELIASKQGYGWLPSLHADNSQLPLKRLNIGSNIVMQQTLYVSCTDPTLIGNAQKQFILLLNELCTV
tara:strand:- start:268 stop:1017 length:750 start_codon:yes stop_codon:yes gene_type:complete